MHLAKQKTSQNAEDLEKLADQIKELTDVLKKSTNAGTPSKSMLDRMDHLSRQAFLTYPKSIVLTNDSQEMDYGRS